MCLKFVDRKFRCELILLLIFFGFWLSWECKGRLNWEVVDFLEFY